MLRNNGTGDSQLWALGPNTSTNGTMTFVVADSDGSATYGFAVGSNTGLAVSGALSATGALAIGNTVAAAVAVASTHKVTIVIGGVTYYLLATNV